MIEKCVKLKIAGQPIEHSFSIMSQIKSFQLSLLFIKEASWWDYITIKSFQLNKTTFSNKLILNWFDLPTFINNSLDKEIKSIQKWIPLLWTQIKKIIISLCYIMCCTQSSNVFVVIFMEIWKLFVENNFWLNIEVSKSVFYELYSLPAGKKEVPMD